MSKKTTPIDPASKDYKASKRYAMQIYLDGIELAYETALKAKEKYKLTEHEYIILFEKLLEKTLGPLKYLLQEFEYLPEDVKNIFRTEEEKELEKKISELVSKRIEKMIKEAEKLGRKE